MLILFMDDDKSIRKFAPRKIKSLGHAVVVTANADEAIAAATNAIFDAAILDVEGAHRDTGVRVARALLRIAPIKIVLVSGAPDPQAGFTFIGKPYKIEDVLLALELA